MIFQKITTGCTKLLVNFACLCAVAKVNPSESNIVFIIYIKGEAQGVYSESVASGHVHR